MTTTRKKGKFINLTLLVIITTVLTLLSLASYFIDGIYNVFSSYTNLPIVQYFISIVLLWVVGLLWVTHSYWKRATIKEAGLENVISSISPDALIVVNRNRDIIMCNASVKRIFGYEADEVINQKTNMLYFDRCSDPLNGNEIYDTLEKEGFHTGLAMGKTKDGSISPLEIITSKLKGCGGAVLLIRDIGKHKRSEGRYHSLIEHANDAIISMDEKGKIIAFNKMAMEIYGYSREEVFGKSYFSLLPPSEREKQKKIFSEIITNDSIGVPFEAIGLRKNGQVFFVENSPFVLREGEGYVLTVFIRNITERKEMERKLLQSEKLKSLGELAGGVAHDFNNLLAAILGRAQLLKMFFEPQQDKKDREKSVIELKKGLNIIEKAAKDGAETVRRIQEFARRRDDDKHFTTVDLNEIIDNALDFTRMKWKDDAELKGIKINIQKEFSTLPTTSGSAAELREVLTNLINNAVDAMPRGGNIKIKTYKEDSHLVVNVEDTGVGIADDKKGQIFDPFFTTKGVQSTGLGMSVSYGIINRHRGTISVDSVKGEGTTFIIKLPITERPVEGKKVKPLAGKIKKARILVVEDEEDVRDILSLILIEGGHEVETANDGIRGIEMFEKKEFDLVFTDLGMPGMSGWQVAEKVKSINKNTSVVLITGWSLELNESETEKSSVDFIVNKPFEVKQILKLVHDGMILRDRLKAA
ncbi:MAG: PAS domain S-box protein [Thermodesulfobacteriota bacterium]